MLKNGTEADPGFAWFKAHKVREVLLKMNTNLTKKCILFQVRKETATNCKF